MLARRRARGGVARAAPPPRGHGRSGQGASRSLVVRDLMFKGLRTFNEFLTAGEGIASNVLSDRLARLEAAGILARRPDPRDARRVLCRLTEKGLDLAPALVEIVLWSERHEATDTPPAEAHEMRAHRARFLASVRRQWAAG